MVFSLNRDKYGGKKYENDEKIVGKTVIITGANSGIGKEVAKGLAKRGTVGLWVICLFRYTRHMLFSDPRILIRDPLS